MKKKLFYYLFIIVIILLLLFFVYKQQLVIENFNHKECDFNHLILSSTQLSDLKELLVKFIEICEKEEIRYFAIGGTLIGAVRNGGLLSFDDDVDVGVLMEDYDKLKKVINNYNSDSDTYYFEDFSFGHKFKKNGSEVFIDIMLFENKGDELHIIKDLWPESSFKNIEEIFPLKQIQYDDMLINVPNQYINYLERNYPSWDKKISLDCGHLNNQHETNYNKCLYEAYDLPKEFDLDFQDSKYDCHSVFI